MLLVSHAFSRKNSGDSLLVDLTMELLQDAGIEPMNCNILALDPDSFNDLSSVYAAPGETTPQLSAKLFSAAGALVANVMGHGTINRLVREATGIIAVGGGYLVADSFVRKGGVLLNHYGQILAAARSKSPTLYLPQSVGPLEGAVGQLISKAIRNVDCFYVRDDESLKEIAGTNIRRSSDLALLKWAREFEVSSMGAREGNVVLIGRALPKEKHLSERFKQLFERIPESVCAIQADTKGSRSDRYFYESLNIKVEESLDQLLAKSSSKVVVSVRLHGALAALISGVPAIHLSYERKGWGAYADLGLTDYVHDARDFDVALVEKQIQAISQDPEAYWSKTLNSIPILKQRYQELVTTTRSMFRQSSAGNF